VTTRISIDFDELPAAVADQFASALVEFVNARHPYMAQRMHGTVVENLDPPPPVIVVGKGIHLVKGGNDDDDLQP
jgi:hypothetical protein